MRTALSQGLKMKISARNEKIAEMEELIQSVSRAKDALGGNQGKLDTSDQA